MSAVIGTFSALTEDFFSRGQQTQKSDRIMAFKNIHAWIVWIPRITGSMSIISSSIIISHFIKTFEYSRRKPNNRLLLSLSTVDILQSIAYTASSAPMPKGDFYGAIGNTTTCTIQGFFIHIGLAVPAYNASLCLFFFLAICKNYDHEVFIEKIEPFCHVFALAYPLISATICASLGLFNGNGSGNYCWLYDENDPFHSFLISFICGPLPVALAFLIILYTMISINMHVKRRNRVSRRHSFTQVDTPTMTHVQQNAVTQAILFTSAFFLTYIWTSLTIPLKASGVLGDADSYLLMQSIFLPLQGFWNFIIFARPLVHKLQSLSPADLQWFDALKIIIVDPLQIHVLENTPRRRRSATLSARPSS